jgi:hypothetical protein
MRVGGGRGVRGAVWTAALAALLAAPAGASYAQPFGGGRDNPIVAYCGAERARLVDLNNQYDEIQRSREAQSLKNGAMAAAGVLAGGMLGGMFNKAGAPGPDSNLPIFGQHKANTNANVRDTAALALVAGLSVSVVTYISLKGQSDDRKALARSIEQDAGGQVPLGRTVAGQAKALSDCRARQVDDYKARLAAAPSDADRKKMKREGDQIIAAIKADIALTDKVVGHQADLAKTFTQARAMADNKSEAQVLGAQQPAYAAAASTTPLDLPAQTKGVSTASPAAPPAPPAPPPPPPPPEVTLVMDKLTVVRAAPQLKAKALMSLPAKREVKAVGQLAVDGWWQIDVAGEPGFIRAAAVSVKGGLAAVSAPPPKPPEDQPDNVREYNKVVLEARDEGPDRMKTLLTSFQ